MTNEQIKNITARQFENVMMREDKTVKNAYSDEEYKVFFRKNDSQSVSQGVIPQEKVTIYYLQDVPITKGLTVKYKNNYYLVSNVNNLESDVYFSSVCIRCNAVWNIDGQQLPLLSTTLSYVDPSSNGVISVIGGNLSIQASDIPFLHTDFNIDTRVSAFGGIYKLVNKFFCDGLAFLSFDRDTYSSGEDKITYNGKTTLPVGTYTFAPSVKHGDIYITDATVTYSSSDETIATVKGDEISFLAEGSVVITMSAKGTIENGNMMNSYNCSTDVTITVVNSDTPVDPENPDVPVEPTKVLTIDTSDWSTEIYSAETGYFDVPLLADGVKVTTKAEVDSLATITYKIVGNFAHTDSMSWNGKQYSIEIYTDDDVIIGKTFTLEVYVNNTLAGSKDIEVLGGL